MEPRYEADPWVRGRSRTCCGRANREGARQSGWALLGSSVPDVPGGGGIRHQPVCVVRACGGEHEAGRDSLRAGAQSHIYFPRDFQFCASAVPISDAVMRENRELFRAINSVGERTSHDVVPGRWLSRSRLPTSGPGSGWEIGKTRASSCSRPIGERRRRW